MAVIGDYESEAYPYLHDIRLYTGPKEEDSEFGEESSPGGELSNL